MYESPKYDKVTRALACAWFRQMPVPLEFGCKPRAYMFAKYEWGGPLGAIVEAYLVCWETGNLSVLVARADGGENFFDIVREGLGV